MRGEGGSREDTGRAAGRARPGLEARLEVGPTPTRGDAAARLRLEAPGVVRVEVVDVLGRRVWASTDRLAAGGVAVGVPAARFPAGAYVVRALVDGAPAASARLTRVGGR